MLGSSKKQKAAKIVSLIGDNTEINGDIRFASGLHVDGIVRGNIVAEDNDKSVLSLSEQGMIEGEIHSPYNIIDGTVNGNVHSSEHIELKPGARITGDVYYNMLEMSGGAQVSGRLIHTQAATDTEPPRAQSDFADDNFDGVS
ncbi:MAG: polymer-forming cytoskeletal protein [Gammaproteobacteria bacterium]|nr:polymer-forming cytoskeletal protein [Gammaproteobacteria bacterium]MCY4337548.1 polymer-forming cytoskeletal protein [Gammaproteobacteria bacterium]